MDPEAAVAIVSVDPVEERDSPAPDASIPVLEPVASLGTTTHPASHLFPTFPRTHQQATKEKPLRAQPFFSSLRKLVRLLFFFQNLTPNRLTEVPIANSILLEFPT